MIEKRKVVLVGTGFVGMSFAYALLNERGIDELVLIDVNHDKAEGEAMDLSHAVPYANGSMKVYAGDYSDCSDASIVVVTAGAAQKPGQTRLDLTAINTKIMMGICESIKESGFKGILLVASNPCDVMTYVASRVTGFDKNRVLGSGTLLDTARLKFMLGELLNVSSENIQAYVMGEHGDSSLVPWTHAYVGAKKVLDILSEKGEDASKLDKIYEDVRDAAYEIINRKKATYYGIGMSLCKLVSSILNNENAVLPVSAYQDNEYGHEGVYTGVPAVVNNEGVREIVKLQLTAEEQAKFDKSTNELKKVIEEIVDPILKEANH